jgi:hypothetical protein
MEVLQLMKPLFLLGATTALRFEPKQHPTAAELK